MAWLRNRKTGKVFNTDWLDAEDRLKYAQIEANAKIAAKLNGTTYKGFVIEDDGDPDPARRMNALFAKKGFKTQEEVENYLKSLSPTRRSNLAREMQIAGRGDEKVKAMAKAIVDVNKDQSKTTSVNNTSLPEVDFQEDVSRQQFYGGQLVLRQWTDKKSGWKVINQPKQDPGSYYIESPSAHYLRKVKAANEEEAFKIAAQEIQRIPKPVEVNFDKTYIGLHSTEWTDRNSGWKLIHRPRLGKYYVQTEYGSNVKVWGEESVGHSISEDEAFQMAAQTIREAHMPIPPRDADADAINAQEYEKMLGPKHEVNPKTIMEDIENETRVNPHYKDYPQPEKYNYHNNCALCTTATLLQARGYDVEAAIRDEEWRGPRTIFDIDFSDTSSYVLSTSNHGMIDVPHVRISPDGTKYITVVPRQGFSKRTIKGIQTMPQGSRAVSRTIVNKMKEWGDGALAELSVQWKDRKSGHSVAVVNNKGYIYIYDSQCNRIETDIEWYLRDTHATRTTLIRLDNVPLKSGIEEELKKMVNKRTPGK